LFRITLTSVADHLGVSLRNIFRVSVPRKLPHKKIHREHFPQNVAWAGLFRTPLRCGVFGAFCFCTSTAGAVSTKRNRNKNTGSFWSPSLLSLTRLSFQAEMRENW